MSSDESDDPAIVLRRCRPWLEKSGPPPVESDKRNFSKRRRKGRRVGDRTPPDFVPSNTVPFGRVVMFGYLAWEAYRRVSAWFSKDDASNRQLMLTSQQRQLANGRQHETALAEPDPRTGMIMQRLVGKTGYPAWATNPVQPEKMGEAVKQQYQEPQRVRRGRRMVMVPREGLAPPEEWLEQQKAEDQRQAERESMRPPPRKSVIPYRRITVLERAARETGTRFDVADEPAAEEPRQRVQRRRQQVQKELAGAAV